MTTEAKAVRQCIARSTRARSLNHVDLERFDALLCPTMSRPAPRVGQTDSDFQSTRDDGRFHGLDMTCPFNFVGQCPVVSVPAGFSREGLPIGVQVVGHRFDDLGVMRIAGALERLRPWAERRPDI